MKRAISTATALARRPFLGLPSTRAATLPDTVYVQSDTIRSRRSSFGKPALMRYRRFDALIFGGAIALAAPVDAAPVLTRVYSQTGYNQLGIFTAGTTGTYLVTAAGGAGGGGAGGAGAQLFATFSFQGGDQFTILTGGAGQQTSRAGMGAAERSSSLEALQTKT